MTALNFLSMKKWTIQVFHNVTNDSGKTTRGVCCFQGEAKSQADFITLCKETFKGQDVKFGAMLPGWHLRIP